MKKLLLLLMSLLGIVATAQVLTSENCSSLTIGNVGTDLTGLTAGQGGWKTYVAASGLNSDFQVIDAGGANGQVFQITGSATAANTRWLFKTDLLSLWSSRTAGNDILEAEFDYFTGPATTSTNSFRVYLYSDETASRAIAGMGSSKNAIVSSVNYSNNVTGYAVYDNAGTIGFYGFGMGTVAPFQITFPVNTWIRIGFSYNKTTGRVLWRGPGINGYIDGAAPGLNVKEIDILCVAGTANTVSSTGLIDNFIVKASATDTLLGLAENNVVSTKFAVSPNPTTGLISVTNNEGINVNEITVTDLNGRVVKTSKFDNVSNIEMNISDLSTGMYMMSIKSDAGTATKKIVKN